MRTHCKIFDINITNLTTQQIKERCSGCLENTGGDGCKWLEKTTDDNIMENNFRVAVPTHNRVQIFNGQLVPMLIKYGIRPSNIDVFCTDAEQLALYKQADPALNYINTNTKTATEKFNFVHSYYATDTNVLVVEDDIKDIKQLAGYNLLIEPKSFCFDMESGFETCRKNKTKLFGISSNSNPFFMGESIAVGYKFICANVYGFIADKADPVQCECESKNDYERTIKYYKKYGSVVRIDYLCPITKNYKTEGGIGVDGRWDMEERSVELLTTKYPAYCKRNEKKQSMYPEMTLRLDLTQGADTKDMKQNSVNDWFK